jgi:hypothetical protein
MQWSRRLTVTGKGNAMYKKSLLGKNRRGGRAVSGQESGKLLFN